MSLTVLDLLSKIKEQKIDDNANVFSKISGGFLYSPHALECACVAIKETEVFSYRIFPKQPDKEKKQKIVLIAEAFEDFDYYHCLTIKELTSFLEMIEDKNMLVCVTSPDNIKEGYISDVINAKPTSPKPFYPNEKMRKMFGNNIFYLVI